MKTNYLKSIFTLVIVALLSTGCVDDDYETPSFDCIETTLQKNKEVADIPATAIVTQYTDDDVIEAYVTSSDKEGNFFKSVSFVSTDGAKAFSIPMDVEATFTSFEPGRKVLIKMKNLYTDISNGGMRIGGLFVNSAGTASVGRLSRAQVQATVFKSCTFKNEDEIVQNVSLVDLKNDNNINKLIELSGVQFVDESVSDTYYNSTNDLGGATNHFITDRFGIKVIFRTSSFAGFAGKTVPSRSGKIRGILTKFGEDYQFLARYESDIKLTDARFSTYPSIFSQNFESVTSLGNGSFLNLSGWSNVSMNNTAANAERWEGRIFSGNKYAQMSLFGTSDVNGDVRLITPAINLNSTSNDILKFGIKTAFWEGLALTVWYSTNYTGSGTVADINAATWTELTTNVPSITDDTFADEFHEMFVNTSSISGTNVHFSFRYRGGTATGVTTLYQLDNVEVVGGN